MPTKIKIQEGYGWCSKCGKELPLNMFYAAHIKNNRVVGFCKVHHNESNKSTRERYFTKMRESKGTIDRRKKIIELLTDNDKIPVGLSPYDGMKMSSIPAWYLIKMYKNNKCDNRIKLYVESNMEVLKAER